jgi:hypothetical protein
MTEPLILAALLHFCSHCSEPQARRIAAAIVPAAQRRGLDPLLMVAVKMAETRGRCNHAVRRERNGSCSHGVFQVNGRCGVVARTRWQNLHRQATRAAYILWLGKRVCQATLRPHWCRWHFSARYNPGRGLRYVSVVLAHYARLKRWAAARGGVT